MITYLWYHRQTDPVGDARRSAAPMSSLRSPSLLSGQPMRARPVGQPDEGGDAQQHGRRGTEQEDPLPAAQAKDAVHVEIAPEIGEPIRPAIGIATMKMPTMMVR
jgi:hypothetical protein